MQQRWQTRLAAFDDMAAKWKSVHLRTLQEDEGDKERLVQTREKIAGSRKEVSVTTKDFAKLDEEGRLAQFGVVLKAYQGHVDDLTKALRFAESAYVQLQTQWPRLQTPILYWSGSLERSRGLSIWPRLQRLPKDCSDC